jgi:hypothetical protein
MAYFIHIIFYREDTRINQPGDFRRELCYRVGRCVPEYGPIDVDLSTTSLKFTTCNQPSADALRSGSLEGILRYIYQQPSCTRPSLTSSH